MQALSESDLPPLPYRFSSVTDAGSNPKHKQGCLDHYIQTEQVSISVLFWHDYISSVVTGTLCILPNLLWFYEVLVLFSASSVRITILSP